MLSRAGIIVIFVFCCNALCAQLNIVGLWKGTLYNDTTQKYYRYEVGINGEGNGKYSGYSHTWFIIDEVQYYGVKKVKIREARDGKIVIEDDELISNNYPIKPPKGVRTISVLDLSINGDLMELSGGFETNRTREFHPVTGRVFLQRKNDIRQSSLVPHMQELGIDNKLSFLPKLEEEFAIEKRNLDMPEQLTVSIDDKKPAPVQEQSQTSQPAVPVLKQPEPPVVKETEPVVEKPKPVIVQAPSKPAPRPVQPAPAPTVASKPAPVTPPKPAPVAVVKQDPAPIIAKAGPAPRNEFVTSSGAAKNITDRKIETIQSLYFTNDSLEVTLYDNGEVDGDTVSVLMNGHVILANQGLSTRAVKKMIYTAEVSDSIQLIMYAENLGSIAPNTGLMIVYDGNRRHEIRFSGDLQKSAAIVFRRKKN